MNTAALMLVMAASLGGECHRSDCGYCSKPPCPARTAWHEFWCNIAPAEDVRMTRDYWPLEYPGARARGWQAHGVAVTKETPINVGPYAVPVEFDEHGIPRVPRDPRRESLEGPAPPVPPAEPAILPSRHQTTTPAQSRFRFVAD